MAQLKSILFVLITLILPLVQGWLITKEQSIGGGTNPYMPACAWVITQAFDNGWKDRTVTIQPKSYLRWGQTRCVVEIRNLDSTWSYSAKGRVIARALMETVVVNANSWNYGGVARLFNPNGHMQMTAAHSAFFGGDVGTPEKRDSNITVKFITSDEGFTPADPATNAFASHLQNIDFTEDAEETAQAVPGHPYNQTTTEVQNKTGGHQKRAPTVRLRDCVYSVTQSGDFELECNCNDHEQNPAEQPALDALFVASCNDRATGSGRPWDLSMLLGSVSDLTSQIALREAQGWAGATVLDSSPVAGAKLYTPASGKDKPTGRAAQCCRLVIEQLVRNHGFAPSACTCDMSAPGEDNSWWHMFVSDIVRYQIAA